MYGFDKNSDEDLGAVQDLYMDEAVELKFE